MAVIIHLQIEHWCLQALRRWTKLAQAEYLVSVANFFLQPKPQHQVFLLSTSCGGCPPGNTQLQGQHAAKTRAQ